MAFLKNLHQICLFRNIVMAVRGTVSHQNVFYRHLFSSNYLSINQTKSNQLKNEIAKPGFNITEMSGKKGFSKNDAVVIISKQIDESVRGLRSQSETVNSYLKFKKRGMLSDGDFVRILVRLAKSHRQGQHNRGATSTGLLYESILEDIKKDSSQLKAFQLADIIWSLGKLGVSDPEWYVHFGSIVETKHELAEFSNADLVMILWGHGKTNNAAPVLFSLIQKDILRRGLEEFTTRELCQIVWSFARVLRSSAKLFAAVRKVIQERDIAEFNNQDLIMLLWAYGEAGMNVKPLFRYFKSELLQSKRLSEYGIKDLSLILWSFSNQGIKAQDLFAKVEREILTQPKIYFDDQSLVIIAWSFACADNKSPRLFKLLENRLMSLELNEWSLHRLARIFWSFTKTGFLSKKLLQKISSAMSFHNLAELPQNSLEEVVFALQFCEHTIPVELVSAVEAELMKRAKEIKA